jgi:hypothetical protein
MLGHSPAARVPITRAAITSSYVMIMRLSLSITHLDNETQSQDAQGYQSWLVPFAGDTWNTMYIKLSL